MSFRSRQTSLTNLSSTAERMETFDGFAWDKGEVYDHKPRLQKYYIQAYIRKGTVSVSILALVCILCYLITTVNHLQLTMNNKNNFMQKE